jgi:hypothetical protein
MKVSTKFQINPSTNGCENYIQSDMGTDAPTDRPTDKVSYRGPTFLRPTFLAQPF